MPEPVVAVLAADLHLCRRPWKHRELEGDADFAAAQLGDLCLALGAPLVLAGDTFDSPRPSPEDIRTFVRLSDRLEAAGLDLLYIQGNHDFQAMPWPLAVTAWPTHLTETPRALGPFRVAGVDYQPADRAVPRIRALDCDLAVCHLRLADLAGRPDPSAPPVAEIAAHRYVLVGDLHRHVVRREGPSIVLSPGSPHRLAIDEDGPKGVFALDAAGVVRAHALRERPLVHLAADGPVRLERLLAEELPRAVAAARERAAGLPPAVATPAVRVTLPAGLKGARAALADAATRLEFHLFVAPRPELDAGTPAAAVVASFLEGGLAAAVRDHAEDGAARRLLEGLVAAGPAGFRRVLDDYCERQLRDGGAGDVEGAG